MDYVFGDEWKLDRKIGNGSFGEIFLGKHLTRPEEVAIKLEPVSSGINQLMWECTCLKKLEGVPGFPRVKWYGVKGGFYVMVVELLGQTIHQLFVSCKKTFTEKCILMLAEQALGRIEAVHSQHLIHRDIKPDNFLVGTGAKSTSIYLIDFGLAKRFKHPKTKQHIAYIQEKGFTGNQRFSSKNAMLGIQQSRRDDLESLGYLLVYLMKGALPWEGLKREDVAKAKVHTSAEELCAGLPSVFTEYLNYVTALGFEEKPDYLYLRNLFRDYFIQSGYEYDYEFDWKKQGLQSTPYQPLKATPKPKDKAPIEEAQDNSCLIY